MIIKKNILALFIIVGSMTTVMSQNIPTMELKYLDNGIIVKKELISQHDGSGECCVFYVTKYVKGQSASNPFYRRILFDARQYYDGKRLRYTTQDARIPIFDGVPETFFDFLDQCEVFLLREPDPQTRDTINRHIVALAKSLGTKYIAFWIPNKGWVNVGAKVFNRVRKKFDKWAQRKGISPQ